MKKTLFLTTLLQLLLHGVGDLQAVLVDRAAAPLASAIHAAVVIVLYQLGALGVTILTAQSLLPLECCTFILNFGKVNSGPMLKVVKSSPIVERSADGSQCQHFHFLW